MKIKLSRKNIILSCILALASIALMVCIKFGYMVSIDNAVYNAISGLISSGMTKVVKVVTFFGGVPFMIGLTFVFLVFWRKNRRGVEITWLMIISTIVNNVIKIVVQRPRPEILQLVSEKTYSFPSGHAMATTTMVTMLIYLIWTGDLAKTKKILFSTLLVIMALLIYISRIYLGVHYFSDILGGIIISLLVVSLFIPVFHKLFKDE